MEQENMDKVLEGDSPQASAAGNLDEQVGLLSASSSSETTRNIINALREEAKTAEADLHAISQRISELLDTKKESKKKTKGSKKSQNKIYRPTSAGFSKLKEFLLETVNTTCSMKDFLPAHAAKKVARDVVEGVGRAHWVTSGFLLIVYFLDRFETLSSNRKTCWALLEEMYHFAEDVQALEKLKGLPETEWRRRDDLAREGTELVVEGSLICCHQMSQTSLRRFFSASANKDDLIDFKGKYRRFHDRTLLRMSTWICMNQFCKQERRLGPRGEEYPDHAVGIEEPFINVTKHLLLGSEERAVAVIVHGFGGIGKTTLADAVFARYYVKDCKYSVVRLDSSPDIENSKIVELQKQILRDLRGTEEGRTSQGTEGDANILDWSHFRDGRRIIGDLLKKEVAFLYIDNVVDPQTLEDLLPTRTLKDAKKLRLLITTRNTNVLNKLGNIRRRVHEMQPLPDDKGNEFLKKEMHHVDVQDHIKKQITEGDKGKKLLEKSGGVPKLLELMIRFITYDEDKISESKINEYYDIVIKDRETLTGDAFSGIDKYIFAYDGLPDESKNPFLDICYFFKEWEWETVANIVGNSALNQLERRAIVSKNKDMISLHDVILTIGKQKAQDTRFDFTNADTLQIKKFFKKDFKLVKGLWFSNQACTIPVDSLDSMHNSLRIFGHKMALEGQCGQPFDKLLAYKGETPEFPFKWEWLENIRFLSYRPQNLALLRQIPSSNLKHIELDGSLCSVRQISPDDIQPLRVLRVLRLINFQNLEKLPEAWGESLGENLQELTLSHCTALKQLTGSIAQLRSLRILKLDNCCYLRRLHKDCEPLSSSLQKLDMRNCQNLKWLPSSFGKALDPDLRHFFEQKEILSDSPQSDSDSDYESDKD